MKLFAPDCVMAFPVFVQQYVYSFVDCATQWTACLISFPLVTWWQLELIKKRVIFVFSQGMFIPAIKGQATAEQQHKWLSLAYKMSIIGCYAQTELGHGSNVQGLETTATFEPATDEFVMHSPTVTSTKVAGT